VVASGPAAPAATPTAASSSKSATISAPGAASDPQSTSVLDPTSGAASASAATPETATPQDAPIAPKANVQGAARNTFTDLIATRELTVSVVAVALIVAAALGAFHALEPGHGKTVVGAYLVGSRGTARHALILGLIVTASHTAGVYLLGGVTFFASQYVVPDRLYPWVALASGLTIAGLGFSLLWRRLRGGPAAHDHHHHHHGHDGHAHPLGPHEHHDHEHHDHAHAHDEHAHDHAHGHGHHHHHEPGAVSLRQLWALGITGGIVPCPAALVVLLSALSLRRVGFGLLLIVAFSLGLALVLIAVGMLMVYTRRLVARFDERGPLVTRWLPLASSAVMTLIGVSIAAQALTSGIMPWKLT
jgi:ABC-type nickel/cobalt efflux system permease component RcnA